MGCGHSAMGSAYPIYKLESHSFPRELKKETRLPEHHTRSYS